MNKLSPKLFSVLTILALVLMALPVHSVKAATTIAQWTFEVPNTPADAANQASYPNAIAPATGTGNAAGAHVSAATDWTTPAGNGSVDSLSSNEWAVGDYYQFSTSTVGFTDIQLSWDQTRSSTGPSEFKLAYSTDGTTFTDFGSPYTILANSWSSGTPSPTSNFTRDLSSITDIENQASVYFRLINNIAPGGTAGSNRVDNFTVSGTAIIGGSTNPSGSGSASPSTVAPGDPTLLTVTVTPGTNPTSTGLAVTCDLSSIGGLASQSFFDDGTNGDVTLGDNIFSFAATVDSGTSEGAKNLPCTIADAQSRTGNASIALTVQEPVAIVINEILADPHATNGDANGDGVVETTNDEFVEIVNNEPSSLNISGWTLSDGFGVRHTFPANTVIPASCSVVVFAAGTPTGTFGRSLVQVASTGQLGLNNGGDTVTLNNGVVNVASYAYGAEGGDDQSLTRDPDVTGADPLVKHSLAAGSGGSLFSPGTKVDGSQFAGCPAEVKIHEVQGSGASSPLAGQTVVIEGIVVGDFQDGLNGTNGDFNGFHVQEEDVDADADPLSSEGIFVFDGSSPAVNVAIGDLVQVQGVVSEFNTLTEITSFTGVTVLSSGNTLPTATALSLPVTAVSDFESYEGMLVTFPQALVIAEYFNFDRFGEIVLTSERHLSPTAEFDPGPITIQAAVDFKLDRITLDDGRSTSNPDPAIHPDGNVFDLGNLFRGGDTVANVTGIMDFAFGLYRIQPTQGATHNNANPRTLAPDDVGGDVKVASFNVLNYFSTLDNSGPICGPLANQDCRGADTALEFTRQRDKIFAALAAIDADVVGLIEIENHATDAALQDLVNGLNTTYGSNVYAYINTGPLGTDAIKVAFIYKPASVTPVGAPAVLDSVAFVNGGDSVPRSRPSLAQAFQLNSNGRVFIVDVNHFKSKGSECDGENPLNPPATGEGLCNQVRVNAATELLAWLATDPTGTGDPDVLIIGDLNSYDKEAPIDTLVAGGFTDMIYQFHGEAAYSYVFDGQIGYLDYALANGTMVDQVAGVAEWHINADEPDLIDYDMSFKQPPQAAIYDDDPYRSSDHDPVLVGLDLLPQCNGQNATVYVDENGQIVGGLQDGQTYHGTLVGTSGDDVIVGTDGHNTIFALGGNDTVCALGANDVVFGGSGNDTVFGGSGNDTVFGDSGNDTLYGEDGRDNLFGGFGTDSLNGGNDHDTCNGGSGTDSSSACEIEVSIP